jgi:hypothetical protein
LMGGREGRMEREGDKEREEEAAAGVGCWSKEGREVEWVLSRGCLLLLTPRKRLDRLGDSEDFLPLEGCSSAEELAEEDWRREFIPPLLGEKDRRAEKSALGS